jgi:hypothetical protein
MDEDLKATLAAARRKRSALENSGADKAKLADLDFAIAGLEATGKASPMPRLIANPTKPAELQPDALPAQAAPKPLTRRIKSKIEPEPKPKDEEKKNK